MIAGLENISGGEILIADRVVNALPPKARDTAMVFQNYALYPHMTVAANMGFSMRLRGARPAEIAARVSQRRRYSGCRRPISTAIRANSRAASASASPWAAPSCATRKVFLFDEPLSNLDAKLRVQMRTEIKALHQRLRTTTVYVTHDQIEAMTMADKIVVMHDGRVEQIGAPLDLYDRPDNQFVAGFIGSPAMNFLHGTIRRERQRSVSKAPAACACRSGRAGCRGWRRWPARRLWRAARTFHPRGRRRRGGNPGGRADRLGDSARSPSSAGRRWSRCFAKRIRSRPGDRVRLKPDVALVHLFDPATGKRLNG